MTNDQLERLLEAFLAEHPDLRAFIARDTGVDLMRLDSDITEEIIRLMTNKGIPVLTIHDSYIVERHRFSDLRKAMTMAAIRIAGYDLFAEQDDIEVDRDKGYGAVLNERVIRNLPLPLSTQSCQDRFKNWCKRRNYSVKRRPWGGLMTSEVNELITRW